MGNVASCGYWRCSMPGSLAHCQRKKRHDFPHLFPRNGAWLCFLKPHILIEGPLFVSLTTIHQTWMGLYQHTPFSCDRAIRYSAFFFRGPFGQERFFHRWRFLWKPEKNTGEGCIISMWWCRSKGCLPWSNAMFFCFFCHQKNNRWLARADAGGLTFFLKRDMPPAWNINDLRYDSWLFQFHWLLMSNK